MLTVSDSSGTISSVITMKWGESDKFALTHQLKREFCNSENVGIDLSPVAIFGSLFFQRC
jgi:hypothetical protein